MVIQAVTILLVLRAHGASEQLKSPDTCVAPVASVKNGLTHQKICTSSKKNTALLNQQPPNQGSLQKTDNRARLDRWPLFSVLRGGCALAKSRPWVIMITATADSRKEQPSSNSPEGCSRVGPLPRKLGRKPGDALNAECMRIWTTTAPPDALKANAISTERGHDEGKDQT